jgi:N6-L-threonylcarbamoyladenine synthase
VGKYRRVGNTRDDAAGEAYDKVAKLLGLEFPGGPAIQRVAARGNPAAIDFPRAMMRRDDFDFSFSGLKTAVRVYVERNAPLGESLRADVAASSQCAINDALTRKTIACAQKFEVSHVYLAGGVAANAPLRSGLQTACDEIGATFHAPILRFCTDNGAMVALAASHRLRAGGNDGVNLDVFARGALGVSG